MPDRYGFDHLGADVRCIEIDCGQGGPMHAWPERRRERHFEAHARVRARETERRRLASLRQARSLKRLVDRESALLDERFS